MTRLKKTKEDKQKRKQYLKTNKKYKKELKNLFKQVAPWDNFIGWFFDIQVRWWKDYYKLGYNVQGLEIKDTPEFEEPNRPTRYEIACEMERLYREWQDFTGVGSVQLEDGKCVLKLLDKYVLPNDKIDWDLIHKDDEELKMKFFNYYSEWRKDMWD